MTSHDSTDTHTRGFRKRERTRRRLLTAAIEVIAERGEGFSISDVTDRAEVSNGTFYNYFDDREALIGAVVPEVVGEFATVNAAVVDCDDPALQFAVVSATALQRAAVDTGPLRVLLRLEAAQRAILDGGVLGHLRADLERGVEAGRFDADVDTATIDVVAGAVLLAVHRVLDRGADDEYAARLVTQLLRSLGIGAGEADELGRRAVAAVSDRFAALDQD